MYDDMQNHVKMLQVEINNLHVTMLKNDTCGHKKHIDANVKNGHKPYLFPQKKFLSVFYAKNIFNTIYYLKPTNFNCASRKCLIVNSTLFSVLFTMFLVYHDLKQKIK